MSAITTVIDTCCLINLYASQRPKEIITSACIDAIVPQQVAGEGLFIRQPDESDPNILVLKQIILDDAIAENIIRLDTDQDENELAQFIQLATMIDDGEAMCMAIASSRHFSLATDDRKAMAIAASLGINVLTTPEILIKWCGTCSARPRDTADVIMNIERYGRFRPHYTSPHAGWWEKNQVL